MPHFLTKTNFFWRYGLIALDYENYSVYFLWEFFSARNYMFFWVLGGPRWRKTSFSLTFRLFAPGSKARFHENFTNIEMRRLPLQ